MSNIPMARAVLEAALQGKADPRFAIENALLLMVRKSPEFVAPRRIQALTEEQKETARKLRDAGLPLTTIALNLHTNIGRVSEAINE